MLVPGVVLVSGKSDPRKAGFQAFLSACVSECLRVLRIMHDAQYSRESTRIDETAGQGEQELSKLFFEQSA